MTKLIYPYKSEIDMYVYAKLLVNTRSLELCECY